MPRPEAKNIPEYYDLALHYAKDKHLPEDIKRPLPTEHWPEENVYFLEKYFAWLISGGASEQTTKLIYIPAAGHVLGLSLRPWGELDPDHDLEPAKEYMRAKGLSGDWTQKSCNALRKFRRFLRLEQGLGEESKIKPFDVSKHIEGLPGWLVTSLERYQHIQGKNWRQARYDQRLRAFWCKHGHTWGFLCRECGVKELSDLKRQHILDYIDHNLDRGYSAIGMNVQLRLLRSFLLFLQEEGHTVPQSLLRMPRLKQPDPLPRYLTDEQVGRLRQEIERSANEAEKPHLLRQAIFDRAAFYLLWQGGMRVGELDELRLEDLDLPGKRLSVRSSKGMKDRTVYLTAAVLDALEGYLAVRGQAETDHVFLYRNAPPSKDLIRSRFKTIGRRLGMKVYPHKLRHTCASQLLNAGCRITSIQRFLGHTPALAGGAREKLSTTMVYARANDKNVAEDYFSAMERVEKRLDTSTSLSASIAPDAQKSVKSGSIVNVQGQNHLFELTEKLAQPVLGDEERLVLVGQLREALWVLDEHSELVM